MFSLTVFRFFFFFFFFFITVGFYVNKSSGDYLGAV